MSSIVKTNTAFTDCGCLLKALESVGTVAKIGSKGEILTDRVDYFGPEKFVLENGRYVFVHDSYADNMGGYLGRSNLKKWISIADWLTQVSSEYRMFRKEKMDALSQEQRIKEEAKMRKIVEQRRDQIISKAKEDGYYIKETEEDGKIRLVLTRTSY